MNDDRPIEKLLRRYAKKRRDAAGDPLELHPATRRLLQGEVSRQFPKTVAERKSAFTGWFAAIRRRRVYATAAASVVLLAGFLLVMNNQKSQFGTKQSGLELAKNEMSPAKVTSREDLPQRREAEAVKQIAAPTVVSAPAPEPPPSQPALATPSAWESDKLPRASAEALAFNANADRQRALKETPANTSPSSPPRDAEQFALAQRALAKKAPQTITTPEAYASAAMTNQLGAKLFVGKPVSPVPTATFADERSPVGIAAQGQAGSLADSSVQLDSKFTANTADNLPAPASVPFETQVGIAPTARYGLSTREKAVGVSQSFANRAPIPVTKTTLKASPTSPVLANFQMEQAGDRLRVIDSDGSIYLGDLNPAPATLGGGSKDVAAFKREEQRAVRRAATASASTQPAAQNYFYRVAGTNRTLNQQVEFTWNFVALTNAPAQSKTKVAGGMINQNNLGAQQQQMQTLLQNSAIKGRAQINAAKEIEINAVPVPR